MPVDRNVSVTATVGIVEGRRSPNNRIDFMANFRVFSRLLQTGKNKGATAINAEIVGEPVVTPEMSGLAKCQNIPADVKERAIIKLRDAAVDEFLNHDRFLERGNIVIDPTLSSKDDENTVSHFEAEQQKKERINSMLGKEWRGKKLSASELKESNPYSVEQVDRPSRKFDPNMTNWYDYKGSNLPNDW